MNKARPIVTRTECGFSPWSLNILVLLNACTLCRGSGFWQKNVGPVMSPHFKEVSGHPTRGGDSIASILVEKVETRLTAFAYLFPVPVAQTKCQFFV